jgi:hypothetical protein
VSEQKPTSRDRFSYYLPFLIRLSTRTNFSLRGLARSGPDGPAIEHHPYGWLFQDLVCLTTPTQQLRRPADADRNRAAFPPLTCIPSPDHILIHMRAVGALGGDTVSTGSVLPPSVQAASETISSRYSLQIIEGQAARPSEARESRSVCTLTEHSERDRWHQPCVPDCEGSRR